MLFNRLDWVVQIIAEIVKSHGWRFIAISKGSIIPINVFQNTILNSTLASPECREVMPA